MTRRPALILATVLSCLSPVAMAQGNPPSAAFRVETVASGLEGTWGLAFLPDGRMLVTEKAGRLRLVSTDGRLGQPIAGLPAVRARGQGGLLDIALDPNFATNRIVYFCFSEPRPDGRAATALARATLRAGEAALDEVKTIFRQQPAGGDGRHFGCRVVPRGDGTVFLTMGDRGNMPESAQDPKTTIGKVVRVAADGSVPADNPKVDGWLPEIWSIGHRNAQGATLRPGTNELWTAEHGSRGGDEINQPRAGRNYGWPVITYGVDYSGAKIGIGTHKEGMEQPVFYWDPSIAPSGLAFYTSDRFPAWKGSLFVGALAGRALVRLTFRDGRITAEERLMTNFGSRIRDVRQGPDGLIYLLTDDGQDRILRLVPGR